MRWNLTDFVENLKISLQDIGIYTRTWLCQGD